MAKVRLYVYSLYIGLIWSRYESFDDILAV